MQQPPKNEGVATFQRQTVDGRTLSYRLKVVQQPEKARACGSGPRSSADRRPVDPPPVVKLTVYDGDKDITLKYEGGFMLFAGLEFARPIAHGRMHQNSHLIPVLTGVCVAGAAYLTKPKEAAYFIFPDLSVRHEGWYRLRFHLFEQIKRPEDADVDRKFVSTQQSDRENPTPPNAHESMANRTDVYSTPFQVFSAKRFPGLNTSTELSKIVADQGCRVRIRRDIRQRKQAKKNKDTGEDERRSINGTPVQTISHERSHSRDSIDRRPISVEAARRVSIDSHMSHVHIPSRHASMEHSAMPSPLNAVHTPLPRAQHSASSPMTPYPPQIQISHSSMPAPPQPRAYTPVQHPAISLPQPHRVGMASPVMSDPQQETMVSLPSISSFLEQSHGPRLQGPSEYALPDPAPKKRSYSPRTHTQGLPLKDGARPDRLLLPPTSARSRTLDWMMNNVDGKSYRVASVNQIMEPDPSPYDDGSDSEDSVLNDKVLEYKRASGARVNMSSYRR